MAEIKKELIELRKKFIDVGGTRERFGDDIFVPAPHTISIKARDLDDLYFKAVMSALEHGRLNYIDSGSYSGSHRIEFDHANLIVEYPSTRPLAPQTRQGIPVSTDNEAIEKYFANYLINGNLKDNEHYTYGSWIVGVPEGVDVMKSGIQRGSKINQLEWCINHFLEDGYGTNHCSITIGCSEALQRYNKKGTDAEKGSTECMRQISYKIKGNQFQQSLFFRSWDLMNGLAENLGGLVLKGEYIIDTLNLRNKKEQRGRPNLEMGKLIANSDGLHLYEHSLDIAKLWANL